MKEGWPDTVRVVLSGYADAATVVESINKGEVYRFVAKPWNDDALKHTILQGLEHWEMVQENRRLHRRRPPARWPNCSRLNGLLEGSVEARTRSLQFAQEVLELLPEMRAGRQRRR